MERRLLKGSVERRDEPMKKTHRDESKNQRKLTLRREALRRLSLTELQPVVGGALCPNSSAWSRCC
jgi:hypothetical protein